MNSLRPIDTIVEKMKTLFCVLLLFFSTVGVAQDERVEQPVKNFDKLWNVFNERYANFEVKYIDWDSVYRIYRPLIHDHTTNDSLFKVCSNMLLALKDGHVNLIQYGKKGKIINKAEDGSPSQFLQKFPISKHEHPNIHDLLRTTDQTLKNYGFERVKVSERGSVQYSKSKTYGYLKLLSMGNLSFKEFKKHAENAAEEFQGLQGLIIDVRFNGGGDDKTSFEFANRFTDKKRIAHYKRERIKGTNDFTKLTIKYLEPSKGARFTGPIIILTSDLTASAAEVFTMIMNELPYVQVIGDHTNGIFSDMYDFKLPNGWLATLSHQQYFSADMKNYEGVGVIPDIILKNTELDVEKGVDPLIARAILELNKNGHADD